MELTTDIQLKGTPWITAIDGFSAIFKARPHYMLYMLAMTVGIRYDKAIKELPTAGENIPSVPRNVMQNNAGNKLDFIFQAAILSTTTLNLTEKKRLELAFGESKLEDGEKEFNKIGFLTEFANFGVTKLVEQIGDTPMETMMNLKDFLDSIVDDVTDANDLDDEIEEFDL